MNPRYAQRKKQNKVTRNQKFKVEAIIKLDTYKENLDKDINGVAFHSCRAPAIESKQYFIQLMRCMEQKLLCQYIYPRKFWRATIPTAAQENRNIEEKETTRVIIEKSSFLYWNDLERGPHGGWSSCFEIRGQINLILTTFLRSN